MANNIKNCLVYTSDTIRQTIFVINTTKSQIALVIDKKEILRGTVTDGDIRRSILSGVPLDSPVEKIMKKNYYSLKEPVLEKDALKFMLNKGIKQVPVLDANKRVLNLFLIDDLIKPLSQTNEIVIMAGGEGKRLGELTRYCPKPMLKLNGKPILEIILQKCINSGFENFYFSVNYLKEQIINYFEDGSKWNISITYLEEDKPMGTIGSLSLLSHKPKQPLLVINGDVLTSVNFNRLLEYHNNVVSDMSLCVTEHNTKIPYGIANIEDLNILNLEEKPIIKHFVNAGIYVMNPSIIDLIPKNSFFDITELVTLAKNEKLKISAFPIHEYWQDLGLPETLNFERNKKNNLD